jgi:hypothetical protein
LSPIQNVPGADDNVTDVNNEIRTLIARSNPQSVWQYYQLVNVLWPESPAPITKFDGRPGPQIPLTDGGATPDVVSNVTMETYIQQSNCLTCHRRATIAPSQQAGDAPLWAADYSFMLSRACSQNEGGPQGACFEPSVNQSSNQ